MYLAFSPDVVALLIAEEREENAEERLETVVAFGNSCFALFKDGEELAIARDLLSDSVIKVGGRTFRRLGIYPN